VWQLVDNGIYISNGSVMKKIKLLYIVFYGCPPDKINKKDKIEDALNFVINENKLSLILSKYCQLKKFEILGFVLLKEIFFLIYTQSKNGVLVLGILTYNRNKLKNIMKSLTNKFCPLKTDKFECYPLDGSKWIEENGKDERFLIKIKKELFKKQSKFQLIRLVDTYKYKKVLLLDDKIQSAQTDEFVYHEALVHPGLLMHRNPKKILILGAGEGATGREIIRHNSVDNIVAIDIDKEVIRVAKKYLHEWHNNVFRSSKYQLIFMDAKKFVKTTNEKFDVIISDLTDPDTKLAFTLYSKRFYEDVKKILKENGIFITQAHCPLSKEFCKIYKNLSEIFKNVCPYVTYVESFNGLWGFMIASDKKLNKKINVSKLLKKRGVNNLKYYDQESHNFMFSLPKYIRDAISFGNLDIIK
jgi:spermidine synthase